MSICFILNPVAGRGKALGLEKILKERAGKKFPAAIFLRTESRGHAIRLAREQSAKNNTVVAVGNGGVFVFHKW